VSSHDKEYLGPQLAKIIEYISKLNELNIETVAPTSGVHCQENVLRSDEPHESTCSKDILDNAPSREGDFFKIPKVIE